MGGPACGVYIPAGRRAMADLAVGQMIRLLCPPGPLYHGSNIVTSDTRPIGGRTQSPIGLSFYCSPDPCRDEADDIQIERAFGFSPEPEHLALGCYCNGTTEQRILAELAAFMSRATGGVIDFHMPLPQAAELPGRTATICWDGVPGCQPRTFLDHEALGAWSRHPDCWMVK